MSNYLKAVAKAVFFLLLIAGWGKTAFASNFTSSLPFLIEYNGISGHSQVFRDYVIKPGDTLYELGISNNATVEDLMAINHLSNDLIKAGDVLVIPKYKVENSYHQRDFTQEDLALLARIIHAEARGESFQGKVAVGAVVLNRMKSPYFPKSLDEVIYQRNQFTPVQDGSINLEPDEQSIKAALAALRGEDPTKGALFFYNPRISSDRWITTLPVITRIGRHVFATAA